MTTTVPSAAVEEYLQAVYTLLDENGTVIAARIASFLGISAPAVSEMIHRLEREGLIRLDQGREVRFTPAGKAAADSIVRRHRLAERFLVDVLGYEWWKTHEEAERLEHAMTPEMEERMTRVLGDPQTCPHGNPMPGTSARPTRTLGSLAPGDEREIRRIPDQFEHEPGFLEYLDSQGLRPGVSVALVATHTDRITLRVDGIERDVRPDCAQKVWVAA